MMHLRNTIDFGRCPRLFAPLYRWVTSGPPLGSRPVHRSSVPFQRPPLSIHPTEPQDGGRAAGKGQCQGQGSPRTKVSSWTERVHEPWEWKPRARRRPVPLTSRHRDGCGHARRRPGGFPARGHARGRTRASLKRRPGLIFSCECDRGRRLGESWCHTHTVWETGNRREGRRRRR